MARCLRSDSRYALAALCAGLAFAPSMADTQPPAPRRPRIFMRTQLKYGLERVDYLHKWYERPLYQDSTYSALVPQGGRLVNDLSWRKQVEIGRLTKSDGFAAFITTLRRDEILAQSVKPGAETTVLVEMTSDDQEKGLAHCVALAGRALEAKNAFRLDGKVVLTRYPSIIAERPQALDFYPEFKRALDARYGADRFALMPYVTFSFRRDRPLATPAAVARTRENIRRVLRKTDGLYYTLGEEYWTDEPSESRRYNRQYHDTVVAPLLKSVMAESEFKGKYLGMGVRLGHENDYQWTYGHDSTGTRYLRDSMASVNLMRPDFILCPEWDEENENTLFRPITSNGHVTQRIMRYWADVFAGRPPEPFPGDDHAIPNLVVSYRKSIQAGDRAEVEVVNIPDGTARTKAYRLSFRWRTPDGRTVREYAEQTLNTSDMDAVWFNCSAVDLLAEHVLLPELTVVDDAGIRRSFGCGMWPMNVEANRNVDVKWVKHALREMDPSVEGALSVGPILPDGTCEVRGRVKGGTRFRNIEVLDGYDTVFMHDVTGKWAPTRTVVRVGVQGMRGTRCPLKGTISVGGRTRPVSYEGVSAGNPYMLYFGLSAAASSNAFVRVHLKELFDKDIRVDALPPGEPQTFCGPRGALLLVERSLVTPYLPSPCGTDAAEFSFRLRPMSRLSVLRLRTIDENFRIWVSPAPVDLYKPSSETRTFHVCEQRPGAPVREVRVDAARCVEPSWRFDGEGAVFRTPGFHDMPCVFGGGVYLITGCGYGEGTWGAALREVETIPSPRSAASLPMQSVPMFAGFELTLTVKPDDVTRPATLFSSGVRGFALSQTPEGLSAWFSLGNYNTPSRGTQKPGETVKGPPLHPGKWNTVKVCFDQSVAWIEVDGVSGERKRFNGWQFGPEIGGLGVAPGKQVVFPGTFGSFSVKLK